MSFFTRRAIEYKPASLFNVIKTFVPHDLWLQMIFNTDDDILCHDGRVEYFGTDEEFLLCLKNYREIPGGAELFEMDFAKPYSMEPIIYQNLDGAAYCYRQDQLVFLQRITDIMNPFETNRDYYFVMAIVGHYLRSMREELKGSFEMSRLEIETIEGYEDEILEYMEQRKNDRDEIMNAEDYNPPEKTLKEVFEKLVSLLPRKSEDLMKPSLGRLVVNFNKATPLNENQKLYDDMLHYAEGLISFIDSVVKTHPDWYALSPANPSEDTKKLVRLFTDQHKSFLMTADVIDYIAEPTRQFFKDSAYKGIYYCIDYVGFVEHAKFDVYKVADFIIYPIRRSRRRATFVPSVSGKYCILASDLLFEILSDLITFKGVFQTITHENWKIVVAFFKEAEKYFNHKAPARYFIHINFRQELRELCNRHFDPHMGKLFKEYTPVRKVGDQGFNLKQFQSELEHLGLMNGEFKSRVFQWAERAYDDLIKYKKPENLTLSDMLHGVEAVQTLGVFTNLPKLCDFLHKQEACWRLPFSCDFCSGKEKPSASEEYEQWGRPRPAPPVDPKQELSVSLPADDEKKNKKKEKKKRQQEQRKTAMAELSAMKEEEKSKCEDLEKKLEESLKRESEKDEEIEKLTKKVESLEALLKHYISN
ncbi:unnamed protein product [Caenorhabditis brenneri]